ncbi:uncharacterized protein LOC144211400 isoform X2 [Stigmatopora nigra]
MIKKMSPSEKDFHIPAKNCYRMVILGSTKVGKTAIVSRFLTGRFDEQYTPTIEDFHRKLYSIRGNVYQLDILDTSGNHPFPAMRRLSILTGTRHQIVPEEQNQREPGRAPGHLRQQGRPRGRPPSAALGDRAAGGRWRRRRKVRLLPDLGQTQRQRGPHVPGALRPGQATPRDEPRPAQEVVATALPRVAPQVLQEGQAGGPGRGLRHGHAVRTAPQRAQRPDVHQGKSRGRWRRRRRRRAGQRQGKVRHQLKGRRLDTGKSGEALRRLLMEPADVRCRRRGDAVIPPRPPDQKKNIPRMLPCGGVLCAQSALKTKGRWTMLSFTSVFYNTRLCFDVILQSVLFLCTIYCDCPFFASEN